MNLKNSKKQSKTVFYDRKSNIWTEKASLHINKGMTKCSKSGLNLQENTYLRTSTLIQLTRKEVLKIFKISNCHSEDINHTSQGKEALNRKQLRSSGLCLILIGITQSSGRRTKDDSIMRSISKK